LVRKNEEVLSIYSLLISYHIKARYIITDRGFSLGDLLELQDFLQDWKQTGNFEKSRKNSDIKYQKSTNNLLKNQVLDAFEEEYRKEIEKSQVHFLGVFKQYLSAIEFDEFEQSQTKVTVSTIHKAKGKEWDEVYFCVDTDFFHNNAQLESNKRLAYVAITRAKNKLHIHSKTPFFNSLIKCKVCNNDYRKLKTIVLLTGLKGIVLSNEYSKKGIDNTLPMAGEEVQIKDNNPYFNIIKNGHQISSLSSKMASEIRQYLNDGYTLQKAEIENIVVWENSDNCEELRQVLCKIYLRVAP